MKPGQNAEIVFTLTEDEFSKIKNLPCEQAALEICKIHFLRNDAKTEFLAPGSGADIRVRVGGGAEIDIEVKGTAASGIAWSQLKVSSQQSHDRLEAGMPLYRVNRIGSRTVSLFVMTCGKHFEMVHEPRWSVRPVKSKGNPSLAPEGQE